MEEVCGWHVRGDKKRKCHTAYSVKRRPRDRYHFTARAYVRAVLAVVILSVCLSHTWIVTNLNGALQIFWYHTKGQSLCYSDTNTVGGRCSLPSEICPQSDPPRFEKPWLWQISAYNDATVRDSEKTSIMTNMKSTTGFPVSSRWSAYATPESKKGGSKSNFFVFWVKVNGWSSQALST